MDGGGTWPEGNPAGIEGKPGMGEEGGGLGVGSAVNGERGAGGGGHERDR